MATCRFILYDTMKVLGISAVLLMVFGAIVALFAGGYDAPLATWLMGLRIILLVFGGMGAALLLIMLTFFGNRFPVRYTLSSFGLRWEALSRRGHWANRVAFVAGLMTGRLAVAGAGALAASRGVEEFRWSDIRRVRFHPREGVISLMNGWRVVMRLHCPPRCTSTLAALCWRTRPTRNLKETCGEGTAAPSDASRSIRCGIVVLLVHTGCLGGCACDGLGD
jgi:hypothetical protein